MKRLIVLATLVFSMNAVAQVDLKQIAKEHNLEVVTLASGETILKQEIDVETKLFMQNQTYTFEARYLYVNDVITIKSFKNTACPPEMKLLDVNKFRGAMSEGITKSKWEEIINKAKESLLIEE